MKSPLWPRHVCHGPLKYTVSPNSAIPIIDCCLLHFLVRKLFGLKEGKPKTTQTKTNKTNISGPFALGVLKSVFVFSKVVCFLRGNTTKPLKTKNQNTICSGLLGRGKQGPPMSPESSMLLVLLKVFCRAGWGHPI